MSVESSSTDKGEHVRRLVQEELIFSTFLNKMNGLHGQSKLEFISNDTQTQELEISKYKSLKYSLLNQGLPIDQQFELTTKMLEMNLEFYTIWNQRRRLIMSNPNANQDLYLSEIQFTTKCLRQHPKSYWVWNHRRWVLEHMPEPNWENELTLVSLMLEKDIRNFHGWAYRRLIVPQVPQASYKSEWDYCTSKIQQNFSNYSAWFYRSQLLFKAFPDPNERLNVIIKELDLVRNAYFTEPNDQSVWFYQRFLLNKEATPIELSEIVTHVSRNTYWMVLVWNRPSSLYKSELIITNSHGKELRFTLFNVSHPSVKSWFHVYSCSYDESQGTTKEWIFKDDIFEFKVDFYKDSTIPFRCMPLQSHLSQRVDDKTHFLPMEIWQRELESIQELIEIEPDCKWALLSFIYIATYLQTRQDTCIKYLRICQRIDKDRSSLYKDQEYEILLSTKTIKDSVLDLSDLPIHRFPYGINPSKFLFIKSVIFSCKNLSSFKGLEKMFFGIQNLKLMDVSFNSPLYSLIKSTNSMNCHKNMTNSKDWILSLIDKERLNISVIDIID